MASLTDRIQFAVSPDDYVLIVAAANREQRSLSEWLRLLSIKYARQVVEGGKSAVNE